ncbi:MAG: ASCH domain-containing protein [Lactobacillales bacterium]|jgi:uncharacterized protein YhfF|nr:ASCH domain-containing protein [Lactobacillales bacterium]
MTKIIDEYWTKAKSALNLPADMPTPISWGFGDGGEMADRLGQLVVDGIKTATCSAALAYDEENEAYPVLGEYNIVLDSNEKPMCVIQNTLLAIKKFNEIDEAHALLEGEGDLSLKYWQDGHKAFFGEKYFAEDMPLIIEHFKMVYKGR